MSNSPALGSGPDHGISDAEMTWPAHTLLTLMPEPMREAILQVGTVRKYRSGSTILSQGELSSHAILLREGFVKVTQSVADRAPRLIDIRSGGDTVGERAAVDGEPRSATVIAEGDVLANEISAEDYAYFRDSYPGAGKIIAERVSIRERATERHRGLRDAPQMFALGSILSELVAEFGTESEDSSYILPIKLAQRELAELCWMAVATLEKLLSELRREGILTTTYRQIKITDFARLRQLAYPTDEVPPW